MLPNPLNPSEYREGIQEPVYLWLPVIPSGVDIYMPAYHAKLASQLVLPAVKRLGMKGNEDGSDAEDVLMYLARIARVGEMVEARGKHHAIAKINYCML